MFICDIAENNNKTKIGLKKKKTPITVIFELFLPNGLPKSSAVAFLCSLIRFDTSAAFSRHFWALSNLICLSEVDDTLWCVCKVTKIFVIYKKSPNHYF